MRRFVLVAYDVSDDKRLRRIFKLLRGYGDHIQYSVFLCQLTDKDHIILSEKIKDIINRKEDKVILITLGLVHGKRNSLPEHWEVIGEPLSIPDHSVMIY
ncbi:CRISPR-associated endonuclease Cas2 [Thermodesulfobacteriota bacterium]